MNKMTMEDISMSIINAYIQYLDNEEEKVEQELLDIQNGKMKIKDLPDEIYLAFENWLNNIKSAYRSISKGKTVFMNKNEMQVLEAYCVFVNDKYVLDNYISDDHIGDGVYKVYCVQ